MLYARKGCLPKGVKSPQPKADRKGQSQTVQTLRAQHPLKYLLHIANLPKSSFYSGLNLNQYGVASPCRTICSVCGFVALS
ncbi:hypothetical protein [Neisseria mucosa]|uniref:hypothetical protein n=1 Tax=Neisseria mucosa TaxID=488 RepID=UPI0031454A54